jgi:4-hydroxybenzoate polyprenyltransferase
MAIEFLKYIKERFPLSANIPVIFIFNITLYMGAGITENEIIFSNKAIPGFIAIFLVFFHLRLFDDLKDYSIDKKINLLTKKQIKIFAFFVILAEIILVLMLGIIPLFFYLIVLLFSILMLYEFFIGKKLEKNVFLYNLSHQIIVVFIGIYIYSFYYKTYKIEEPIFFLYLLLMLSILSIFELIRKIKNKNDDDYEKSYEFKVGKFKFTIYTAIFTVLIGISCFIILFFTIQSQINAVIQIFLTLLILIGLTLHYVESEKMTNKLFKTALAAYILSTLIILDLTILFTKDIIINLLGWMTVL